jgi:IS5 family transposase
MVLYYKYYIIFCMRNLIDFAIRAEYARVKALGDDLCEIGSKMDWERFRFLEPSMYKNKTSLGGRPNIDIVIMMKLLVLQHWFGLSDPELERQVADRISFRIFIGTTEVVPDFSTVWLFRERLIKNGKFGDLWNELQRQIDEKGFTVKEGSIQDATFITSDPGRKRKKKGQEGECKKEDQELETIRSNQAQEFDKGLLDISINVINSQAKPMKPDEEPTNEGSWAKKGVKNFFGYKGHILIDTNHHLIRNIETTTASVHDSQVDLGIEGIPRYADKGYDGAKTRGYNAAMKKATRGHKLVIQDILRNRRISKKRSPIERCFDVMKRAHKAGHVLVRTVARAGIKFMMSAFVYNLVQLKYLAHNPLT